MRFRITYSNGWEIIDAKDIFAVAELTKRAYRRRLKMPVAIEECLAFPEPRRLPEREFWHPSAASTR